MRGEAGRITPPAAFPLGGGAYTFAPPPSIPMALNFVAQPQARGVALRPSPSAPVVYTMPSDASDPPPRRKTSHEDRHDLVKSWSSVTFSPPRSASPLVFEPCAYEVSVPGRTGKTEKTFFRCQACNATSTPEVRVGPDGKRNLCNKCGIRYAKRRRYEEDLRRRMSVSALLTTDVTPRKRVRPDEDVVTVKTEST